LPTSAEHETPVTGTLALPTVTALALLTEAVPATPVTERFDSEVTVVEPTAPVPATPVTEALSPLVIETVPIEVAPLTPMLVVNVSPTAPVPATPVTDTIASPSWTACPTLPVAVTSKVGLVFQVLVFQALVELFQPINVTVTEDIRLSG
jgi:hypothetical protein|tara:strand:+ start:104 stop:553 length:450 start_codon:yes stop_codon:yes gene_type:complete